jgi:hypothetical protein
MAAEIRQCEIEAKGNVVLIKGNVELIKEYVELMKENVILIKENVVLIVTDFSFGLEVQYPFLVNKEKSKPRLNPPLS